MPAEANQLVNDTIDKVQPRAAPARFQPAPNFIELRLAEVDQTVAGELLREPTRFLDPVSNRSAPFLIVAEIFQDQGYIRYN